MLIVYIIKTEFKTEVQSFFIRSLKFYENIRTAQNGLGPSRRNSFAANVLRLIVLVCRQLGREGKARRCFYDDPDRLILIQLAPWPRYCVLG